MPTDGYKSKQIITRPNSTARQNAQQKAHKRMVWGLSIIFTITSLLGFGGVWFYYKSRNPDIQPVAIADATLMSIERGPKGSAAELASNVETAGEMSPFADETVSDVTISTPTLESSNARQQAYSNETLAKLASQVDVADEADQSVEILSINGVDMDDIEIKVAPLQATLKRSPTRVKQNSIKQNLPVQKLAKQVPEAPIHQIPKREDRRFTFKPKPKPMLQGKTEPRRKTETASTFIAKSINSTSTMNYEPSYGSTSKSNEEVIGSVIAANKRAQAKLPENKAKTFIERRPKNVNINLPQYNPSAQSAEGLPSQSQVSRSGTSVLASRNTAPSSSHSDSQYDEVASLTKRPEMVGDKFVFRKKKPKSIRLKEDSTIQHGVLNSELNSTALISTSPSTNAPAKVKSTQPKDRSVSDSSATNISMPVKEVEIPSTASQSKVDPAISLLQSNAIAMHQSAGFAIAIIVNSKNNEALSADQLKHIYTDKVSNWSDGSKIITYNLPVESKGREVFAQKILDMTALQAATAESRRAISNQAGSIAITKNDRLVISYVSRKPNAIGYVPLEAAQNQSGIKIVMTLQ